jgi:hypothetical protein
MARGVPFDRADLDGIVSAVFERLRRNPPGSAKDVYVWSDGSVSGPLPADSPAEDRRLIALFTPGETLPPEGEVRETIARGLLTVPPDSQP